VTPSKDALLDQISTLAQKFPFKFNPLSQDVQLNRFNRALKEVLSILVVERDSEKGKSYVNSLNKRYDKI
jgi:hypothetical protein